MTSEPSLARVQAIVARVAGPHRTPPDAGPDTPLGAGGFWLDSVDLLETLIACEAEFGVVFNSENDLNGEVGTVSMLLGLIRAQRAS
jgi:acyl carrier protein